MRRCCTQRASRQTRASEHRAPVQPGSGPTGQKRPPKGSGTRVKAFGHQPWQPKCVGSNINNTAADFGWISAQEAEQFIRCDGGNPPSISSCCNHVLLVTYRPLETPVFVVAADGCLRLPSETCASPPLRPLLIP